MVVVAAAVCCVCLQFCN